MLILIALLLLATPLAAQVTDSAGPEAPVITSLSIDSIMVLRMDSVQARAEAVTGCHGTYSKGYVKKMARELSWVPADTLALVACHRYWIGMHVQLLVYSIGKPNVVNRTSTAYGQSLQLVYRHPYTGKGDQYFYVEHDTVTAIQD